MGRALPENLKLSNVGQQARTCWIKLAQKILSQRDRTGSGRAPVINPVEAREVLLEGTQTVEEYLALMSQENPGPEAWGGESELHVLATMWKCRICTMLERTDPREGLQTRLLWGPLGTGGPIHTMLFNGTHYDLVGLTPEQLTILNLNP